MDRAYLHEGVKDAEEKRRSLYSLGKNVMRIIDSVKWLITESMKKVSWGR